MKIRKIQNTEVSVPRRSCPTVITANVTGDIRDWVSESSLSESLPYVQCWMCIDYHRAFNFYFE